MSRKRYTVEAIVGKLREAEVELSKGLTVVQVSKKLGINEQTYYRWRKEYGGLRTDQAHRLKALERENARLKKLVAEQALDLAILKEASSGNRSAQPGDSSRYTSGRKPTPWTRPVTIRRYRRTAPVYRSP